MNSISLKGRACGAAGWTIAADSKDQQFKFQRKQINLSVCLSIASFKKDDNEEKEAEIDPFKKLNKLNLMKTKENIQQT